jgi:hypothetical protein
VAGDGSPARSRTSAAAQEFVARPGTMMVDVRVSRNVLSVPYRRLHYGQDA